MLFVQKWPFFQLFFLGNIGQENVFDDILERKNAFLSYKNNKFKKSKIDIFPRGFWLWSKNGHFSTFFVLGKIGQENVFDDILEQKNAFLSYKKNKFKKSKSWHFSKGVNSWFLSKMAIFPTFFVLSNIGQDNVCDDILGRKNAFLSYKATKSKSPKLTFFQGG